MMIAVNELTQRGGVLNIDNKFFTNCKVEGCQLIYTGGDFGWTNSTFANCQLSLQGDALRTFNFLKLFGFEVTRKTQEPPKESSKMGFV